MAVLKKNTVLWDMASCSLVENDDNFAGTAAIIFCRGKFALVYITSRHVPEDRILQV